MSEKGRVNVVSITQERYDELLRLEEANKGLQRDANWLMMLESAGVDNWQGFDFAHELKREAIASGDYTEDDFN